MITSAERPGLSLSQADTHAKLIDPAPPIREALVARSLASA